MMVVLSTACCKLIRPVALQKLNELNSYFSAWLKTYVKKLLIAWCFVNCFLKMNMLSTLEKMRWKYDESRWGLTSLRI